MKERVMKVQSMLSEASSRARYVLKVSIIPHPRSRLEWFEDMASWCPAHFPTFSSICSKIWIFSLCVFQLFLSVSLVFYPLLLLHSSSSILPSAPPSSLLPMCPSLPLFFSSFLPPFSQEVHTSDESDCEDLDPKTGMEVCAHLFKTSPSNFLM